MKTFQDALIELWPHGDRRVPGLVEGIAAAAPAVFQKYGLRSALTVAHAMAQFSHECGAGAEMVENINYSAQRASEVWESRFHKNPSLVYSKCDSYPGDPNFHAKLIDHVYGGRMGNRPYPSHDGSTYIGRGLSQMTGRDGYEAVKRKTGIDVISHPEYASDPRYALEVGVADFVICGCLPYAEKDNAKMVTRRLNGGYIGLAEREQWLRRWKAALVGVDVLAGGASVPLPTPRPDVPMVPDKPPAPKKGATVDTGATPKEHAKTGSGAVIAGAGAGAAAHEAGLPTWAVVAIGAAVVAVVAFTAYKVIKQRKLR